MTEPAAPPRMGRPPAADPAAVAALGLRLMLERGYDAVTMSDVAAAAGIGRSTLLRYFPSKLDLFWGGYGGTRDRIAAALAAVGPDESPFRALGRVLAHSLDHEDVDVLRNRVRILGQVREPPAVLAAYLREVDDEVRAFLHDRCGWDPEGLEAYLFGRCCVEAGTLALERWSVTDDASPIPLLEHAYDVVARGFEASVGVLPAPLSPGPA